MNKTVNEPSERLPTDIDKLWYFAQLEKGVEIADIDREAIAGSATVIQRLGEEMEDTYHIDENQRLVAEEHFRNKIVLDLTVGNKYER